MGHAVRVIFCDPLRRARPCGLILCAGSDWLNSVTDCVLSRILRDAYFGQYTVSGVAVQSREEASLCLRYVGVALGLLLMLQSRSAMRADCWRYSFLNRSLSRESEWSYFVSAK